SGRESTHHEVHHRAADPAFAACRVRLVVLAEPPVSTEPGAFCHLSSRRHRIPWAPIFHGLDRLAVQYGGTWRGLMARSAADLIAQRIVDALQGAVQPPVPKVEPDHA